jgi:hypothetical protein
MATREKWLELARRCESLSADNNEDSYVFLEWEIMKGLGYVPHTNGIHWVRHSDLARFPGGIFDWISHTIEMIERELPQVNCHGYNKDQKGVTAYVSRNCVSSRHRRYESLHCSKISHALSAAFCRAMAGTTGVEK